MHLNTGEVTDKKDKPIPSTNRPASLDEVAEELRNAEVDLVHDACPISGLLVEDGELVVFGRRLRLGEAGIGRVCEVAGAPAGYLNTLELDLRNRNLEYSLRQAGKRENGLNDKTARIVSRNDQFIGFERSDLYQMSGVELVEAIRDGLGNYQEGLRIQNYCLANETVTMDLVTPRNEIDVYVGDAIQAGVHVEHSLIGEQATTVMAYILRLACENGMTHRECSGSRKTNRTRRIPTSEPLAARRQFDQVSRFVSATVAKLSPKLEAIKGLAKPLDGKDAERLLEQFLRRSRLYSQPMMQLARRAWLEPRGGNSQETYFGVLNTLTWLATHATEISERQRHGLSRLAGIFANQDVHMCTRCFGSGVMADGAGQSV